MKKTLLSTVLLVFSIISFNAQTIEFTVEAPAGIAGPYGFSSTNDVAGWGSPDLLDTANAVMDTLMFVDDGTAGTNPQGNPMSAEGCNPLINDLSGKIAVIYRNTCQFGTKILNAENAGAVAAIIINREPGLVNMAPGDDGANVTIPAIFIEDATGLIITNEMANGPVVAFIGTRSFSYNVAIANSGVIRPEAAATPSALAQSNAEYEVQLGAWVTNPGSQMNNVTLKAVITEGGTTLYDQSSAASPIMSGDSVYVSLPTFSQASYNEGMYTLTYTVNEGDTLEEFGQDNVLTQDFHISSTKYSNATLDSNAGLVLSPFYRPGNATGSVSMCTHLMDPNASRMAAMGVSFAAVVSGGDLTGRYFSVYAHEITDVFTDLTDPNFVGITGVNTVAQGEFTYPTDSAYQEVYVPFLQPFQLTDGQRYLFCVNTFDTDVYIGFDDNIDYTQNVDNVYLQPVSVVENSGTWYTTGFGNDVIAGVSVELSTNLSLEDNAIDNIKAYPNPATTFINVPLNGVVGNGTLNILDLTGKLVSTMNINVNNTLTVDVSTLSNGTYTFNLMIEDGKSSRFNVVINK